VNFPGAMLFNGGDNEKSDFHYWPAATVTDGCTVVNTGSATIANTVTSAFANTGTSTFVSTAGAVPTAFTYTGTSALSTAGAVPTTFTYTLSPTVGTVMTSTPWYRTPDTHRELVKSVWRGPSKARTLLSELKTSDTTDVTQEPMTLDAASTDAPSTERVQSSVASQPQERIRKFRARRAEVTTKRLTGLAVFIAGRRGTVISAEWCAHLSGETGTGLPSRRQARESAGFVLAAVRYRLQDASDLWWRLAERVLVSRSYSKMVVWLPSLIAVMMVIRRESLYGVVVHFESLASLTGALSLTIHVGRKRRGVKPPKRVPRRRSELVRRVDTLPSNYPAKDDPMTCADAFETHALWGVVNDASLTTPVALGTVFTS